MEEEYASSYSVQTEDHGNPNLAVVVRVRPENQKEAHGGWRRVVKVLDEHVLVFDPATATMNKRGFQSNSNKARDHKYAFDRVFDDRASQNAVFEVTTKPLIETVMSGCNATVFCYGATGFYFICIDSAGSGKTHTMIGNSRSGPGVMVLTMEALFEAIQNSELDKNCRISMQYLEVYNETIRDLLIENSPALNLTEDSNGVHIAGLSEKFPKTAVEVFSLLEQGNKNRRQSPTDANEESSRSHAVLQISVKQKDKTADISSCIKVGKLSLVDLAGSERASATKNRGDRMKEGANINKSLLALGNCINSLGENYKQGKHVPYRNSKLTRLLKDSLGGNCKTVMIANVSPSAMSFEDTLNTLKYANRAKNIKTKVTRTVVNVNYHVAKYTEIIAELKKEVLDLKSRLIQKNPNINERFLLELEELKKENQRIRGELTENKDAVKEFFGVLSDAGLATERHRSRYFQVSGATSPPRSKQAWVPVQTPTPKRESTAQSTAPITSSGGKTQIWVPRLNLSTAISDSTAPLTLESVTSNSFSKSPRPRNPAPNMSQLSVFLKGGQSPAVRHFGKSPRRKSPKKNKKQDANVLRQNSFSKSLAKASETPSTPAPRTVSRMGDQTPMGSTTESEILTKSVLKSILKKKRHHPEPDNGGSEQQFGRSVLFAHSPNTLKSHDSSPKNAQKPKNKDQSSSNKENLGASFLKSKPTRIRVPFY